MITCSTCPAQIRETDGWPGSAGGTICQDCWEAESSRDWWQMLSEFDLYWRALRAASGCCVIIVSPAAHQQPPDSRRARPEDSWQSFRPDPE